MEDVKGLELEFKLPLGKPPYIGVVFPNDHAGQVNRELFDKHKDRLYSIIMEPVGLYMNLYLSASTVGQRKYLSMSYDRRELDRFIRSNTEVWTFGHLTKEFGEPKPIRSSITRSVFALKVEFLKLHYEY